MLEVDTHINTHIYICIVHIYANNHHFD